jgi:hypothetical protein
MTGDRSTVSLLGYIISGKVRAAYERGTQKSLLVAAIRELPYAYQLRALRS